MLMANVYVTFKKGVLDPQGNAVKSSLESLGYEGVEDVKVGKFMEIKLKENDKKKAEERVNQMCEKLLANTVIEDYRFEITEV